MLSPLLKPTQQAGKKEFTDNPTTSPVNVSNAPEGVFLNVGMKRGKTAEEMTMDEVKEALPSDV